MKKFYLKIYILVLTISLTFCTQSKHNATYNGIDHRILQIIDSLPKCDNIPNFVSVLFTVDTSINTIVKIFNDAFIPVPISTKMQDNLISESSFFRGYKKYNDRYILFIEFSEYNHKFSMFVCEDSLIKDESLYERYNVYDSEYIRNLYKSGCYRPTTKLFLITSANALIPLNK